MKNHEELVRKLTLALIYLTSFKDKQFGFETIKSWKGYDYSILYSLTQENLIYDSKKSKSVSLTDEGKEKALEVVNELLKCIES